MSALSPASLPVTPAMLERAGLRLELTASAWRLHNSQPFRGDDEADEAEYQRVERTYEDAKRAYRAMLELMTGHAAETIEHRVSL